MNNMHVFLPLAKVDEVRREVWGRAAIETPDRAKEIFDYATSKPHFEKWSQSLHKASGGKSLGNVRAMHGKTAAGKLTHIEYNDIEKAIDICAKIVDDNEWNKVLEGTYTGFSIGGSYAKRWKDGELYRYTANPTEISIVDVPCIPGADFLMVKSDGTEMRKSFSHVADDGLEAGEVTIDTDLTLTSRLQDTVNKLDTILHTVQQSNEVKKMSKEVEEKKPVQDDADKPAEKAAEPVEMTKRFDTILETMNKVLEANTTLQKNYEVVVADNAELKKRLVTLEAEPETPKAALLAVAKGDDVIEQSLSKKLDEIKDPKEMVKAIHAQGPTLQKF